jgi:hypothetical protein
VGYTGLARLFALGPKIAGAARKLLARIARRGNVATSSSFEGVSQRDILKLVQGRFSIRAIEFRFLFLPIVVSSLRIYRLPHALSVPLTRFLYHIDKFLTDSGVFRGPYVLAIAQKR